MHKHERHWRALHYRSNKRGTACCSFEEFRDWYKHQEKKCNYCGIEEEFLRRYCTATNYTASLHVDRVVNSEGCVIGNIVLACYSCNVIIKSTKTDDFVRVVVKSTLQNGMLDEYHLWNVPAEKREEACRWPQFRTVQVYQRGPDEVTRIITPNDFHYMPKGELAKRIRTSNDSSPSSSE